MSSKFQVYFTKTPEKENPITPASLAKRLWDYLKKVFWYAKAQIVKRRKSYRSMFVISVVMLSFVFTNLILNEARLMGAISSNLGGTHHIMFYGITEKQAEGAADHRLIKDSLIIPVIASFESSVDSSTVGKVAVLTDEIREFMQIGITHGSLPEDNEIIVPRGIYSCHSFLILGKEQDMYFSNIDFIYRPMSLSGLYNSTDEETPYVFVNEKTGAEIRKATGNDVSYDVYLTISVETDRSAATLAGEIIKKNKIRNTEEQAVNTEESDERSIYRDYINPDAASYRSRNELDINRIFSFAGVVIAALIMASFMTNYTERHISEYGILASYGAKRRHLFGVVIGQVLFITVLSLIPVLLISMGVAWLYTEQYNLARLESNLPVIMRIPQGILITYAIRYVLLLCFLCFLTMNRMMSQFPYPMVRGNTAEKMPFIRNSSKWLEKAKDKVRHIAFLQSMRLVKRHIIPATATSVICVLFSAFIVYNFAQTSYFTGEADIYGNKSFDGYDGCISSIGSADYEDGFWRGYITAEDMEYLTSLDGVKAAGGIRSVFKFSRYGSYFGGTVELFVEEAKAAITKDSKQIFDNSRANYHYFTEESQQKYDEYLTNGYPASFTPYYCDESLLPFLVEKVLDGDTGKLYTEANTVIIVDNAWADNDAHYHAGDTVKIREDKNSEPIDMTVAAIISGNYVQNLDAAIVNGSLIMSPETGENVDGFPADLRRSVYFAYDDDLSDEDYQALCDEISDDINLIRYDVTFYETERLKATKMASLENGMTAIFFAMLYIAMCVLDYYHSNESILAQRKEFCTLRQMGASEKDIKKTTRTSVYAGQLLSIGITMVLAIAGILLVNGWCANLANMYRLNFEGNEQVLRQMLDMVHEMQVTYFSLIGILFALAIPLHGLAFLTSIAGTVLPTKRILSENIAQTLKGSAEI